MKITQKKLGKMIMESINKTLNENPASFYDEEDENGNTGEIGQVKSYDCGYMTLDNAENEAEETGYNSVEDYLRQWWNEAGSEAPFEWITLGGGYGFHGSTIFEEPQSDGGTLRCKEIYGQIIFDVYPPQNLNESEEQPKKNKLLKHYTNGTDYDVCVFALKDNKYAVTVYDTVYREHTAKGKFNSQEEAIAKAKEINKAYRI